MQNLIFAHAEAASCSITVDKIPSAAVLARLETDPDIIEITT
jgi:hypothetical protein